MAAAGEREVLEVLAGRYFGKYRGVVTNADDPERRGRIRARVPAVLQDQETGWCLPAVPYAGPNVGFVCLPEPDAGVWIEFEGGDVSYPIWTGCWWGSGQLPQDAAPDVKVWRTASGHQITLDDNTSAIRIKDARGNEVVLDDQGITLKREGQQVQISNSAVNVDNGALEVR